MSTREIMFRRANLRAERAKVDWSAVYADELPRVYNYFRYRLGDVPEVEDLTSATFERAWRHRNRYRHDQAAFSTWLFTIAGNLLIDHYRKRRPTTPLEDVVLKDVEPMVEDRVQAQEDCAHLQRLLVGLPEREQELIALKYGADLTNREIARLTGLSETNVGSILYRVVRKLRQRWEQDA
jgi:RNA polymerase sigma-70 factor, ECF subfamily